MERVTPRDVAMWMRAELDQHGHLRQSDAADGIVRQFGPDFVYENDNGNPGIEPRVLDAFRRLTGNNVVWVQSEFKWRYRRAGDQPGRRQD
jgi:hypothetical protein